MTPMSQPLTSPPPLSAFRLMSPGEMDRTDRIVQAAAEQIAERGAAASARSIAAAAGAAPSAINYNFGSIERLFSAAFAHGVRLTADWLEARGPEILALPKSPEGAVQALEHLVAAWTRDARPLALLYQECLGATAGLAPEARELNAEGPGGDWIRLWRDHWLRTATAFGLGEAEGRLLHLLFQSEALFHLSAWSPALEGAALREMCDHFGATWLGGARRSGGEALILAERTAGARSHGSLAPSALRIADGAAEVVEARGLGGLTHRAVAARAGVTTGAVTHHFRTVEDLVAGAIRGQVAAMTREPIGPDGATQAIEDILTADQMFEAMELRILADRPLSVVLRRRSLFLATVRRADLAGAGAVIRFSFGGTARDAMGRIYRLPADTLVLHASLLSRLLATIWIACAGDASPQASREAATGEILGRLRRRLEAG